VKLRWEYPVIGLLLALAVISYVTTGGAWWWRALG
jgi:hypothetical protein